MSINSNKKLYISVLNVVSCLSVVALHANGIFWNRPHGRLWITSNIIETVLYFAVPIFFMISGANLIDYRERYSTKEFLKKRFAKTLVPFIFWSLVAGIFVALLHREIFDTNLKHITDNILQTKYMGIYWFFPSLFAVYLSMPVISAVNDKIKVYTYASVVGIVFVGILPLIFNLLRIGSWPITPPIVAGYMIYVMLGYIFDKIDLSKDKRAFIYVLGVLGWLMHIGGTLIMSRGLDTIDDTFKGYLNIPCIMYSSAVFVLFKHINYEKLLQNFYQRFCMFINKMAECSFGIYLLHMFIMKGLQGITNADTRSMLWRLGGPQLYIY